MVAGTFHDMRWLLLLSMACSPHTRRIESIPVGALDGDIWEERGLIHVAVVGHGAKAPTSLFDQLRQRSRQLVLLAGDAVIESKAEHWNELRQRVQGLRVLPMVGGGERERDPRLRGFYAAWEGAGVTGLGRAVPWYSVDLHSRGARWRLVVLDPHRAALEGRWADQLFWVPKVVGDRGYDHLIVALHGGPGRMDGADPDGNADAAELLRLVRRHTEASRMVLVIVGGARAPAFVLPTGRWGEGWLSAGLPASADVPLWRVQGDLRLAPGFALALVEEFEARAGERLEQLRNAAQFDPAQAPVAGFWTLGIDGAAATITLHISNREGTEWSPAFTTKWSGDLGWHAEP